MASSINNEIEAIQAEQDKTMPFRFLNLPKELQLQIIHIYLLNSVPEIEREVARDHWHKGRYWMWMSRWDRIVTTPPFVFSIDRYKPFDHATNYPIPALWHVNQEVRSMSVSLYTRDMLFLDLQFEGILAQYWLNTMERAAIRQIRRFQFHLDETDRNFSQARVVRLCSNCPSYTVELNHDGTRITVMSSLKAIGGRAPLPRSNSRRQPITRTVFDYLQLKVTRMVKRKAGQCMDGWDIVMLAMAATVLAYEKEKFTFKRSSWDLVESTELCTRIPETLRVKFLKPWNVVAEGQIVDFVLEDAMEQVLWWFDE